MAKTFPELRVHYPRFIFESFTHELQAEGLVLSFKYRIEPDLEFTHQVVVQGVTEAQLQAVPSAELQRRILDIGLVEMLSYWKTTCAPEIVIKAGSLLEQDLAWWHDLLIQGMGEFFYVNQIDFTVPDFVKITSSPDAESFNFDRKEVEITLFSKLLIPVGGGKDSAVSLELLKQNWSDTANLACLLINPTQAARDLAAASGLHQLEVNRQLDPRLFELNSQGFLNGHVPFSASVAFISVLTARLHGFAAVAVSNERSSNEGSAWWRDHYINHQYSKTFEFETKFQTYAGRSPLYFSFMRPLFELQIAQLFAQLSPAHPEVLSLFRSCNRGQKTNSWCGDCPKCLFAYAILYPFLSPDQMLSIFGQDLWQRADLWPIAAELLGCTEKKPLECVGTHEENLSAFYLSAEKIKQTGATFPALLAQAEREVFTTESHLAERATQVLNSWNAEHSLPPVLAQILKIGSLAAQQLVIFGFGREGRSTYSFLRHHFPDKKLIVIDDNLAFQTPAEFNWNDQPTTIFKTPGIAPSHPFLTALKHHPTVHLSSNTQLFLELVPHQIVTIGVTGTKGKSTTTSLIDQVLKTGGVATALGGNIGVPALDLLIEIEQQQLRYVVLELSCHQLADLHTSPDIAVIQNITPEHLDFYATFEEYVAAKSQITRFQSTSDEVIYCADFAQPTQLAALSPGTKTTWQITTVDGFLTYAGQHIIALDDIPLKGSFNLENIMPAIVIGQKLGLSTEVIRTALQNFQPLEHRLELVKTINGVEYYNDSLSTTPVATLAALASFPDQAAILIAGGHERNLDYQQLAEALAHRAVRALILFKPTGDRIWQAVTAAAADKPLPAHFFVETMAEAVSLAHQQAQTGDVVLMSPASPSFSQFKDYADRGQQFKAAVGELP